MRRVLVPSAAIGVLLCSATVALAAPRLVDRLKTRIGTIYTLQSLTKLDKGQAKFRIAVDEPDTDDYDPGGTVKTALVRLARDSLLVVGSSVDCNPPGASLVYGTVRKRVRRVVVTLRGGRRLRLNRRRPPRAWKFDGWVVGGIAPVRRAAKSVSAFDADGDRLAFARFAGASGCV